jgi:type I restriction enzyme S subunit
MKQSETLADIEITPNPNWAQLPLFDRSKWETVTFGDVVQCLKEQVDPESGEVERYVAGEHMDTADVHIRRWGTIGDGYLGPAFIRRFRKGQVLYGSRRTYLKKVSVADFDGVTANTTLVLQAKEGLLQELLPWIMLSDKFTEHSVRESKGSVNPYINWTDIAWFEFALPPLDQQRRIAELLWAVDEAVQQVNALIDRSESYRASLIADFISRFSKANTPIGRHLTALQYGSSSRSQLQQEEGALPILRIPNVIGGEIDYADLAWQQLTPEENKYILKDGDVLIVRTNGNPDYVGRTALYERSSFDRCLFASYLIRLQTDETKLLPSYLHEMLESAEIKSVVKRYVRSSAGNYNLNTDSIRKVVMPVPDMNDQLALIEALAPIDSSLETAKGHLMSSTSLRSIMINSCLGGGL